MSIPYPSKVGVEYVWDKRGAICPRCHTFIAKRSKVKRLARPESPNSLDGRMCSTTGQCYYADGRRIDMSPRWWVHSRCYDAGRQVGNHRYLA